MLETVIILKPRSEWRHIDTWYSSWSPDWAKRVFFRHITPDTLSSEELVAQMNTALKIPGVSNAWTMPIKGRIDMLTTGIRTPVGLKISGSDLAEIERIGTEIENSAAVGQGNPQRFRGADGRRIFSRHRLEARGTGTLRVERRRGAAGGRKRHRWRECLHCGDRTGALSGQRPLHARFS